MTGGSFGSFICAHNFVCPICSLAPAGHGALKGGLTRRKMIAFSLHFLLAGPQRSDWYSSALCSSGGAFTPTDSQPQWWPLRQPHPPISLSSRTYAHFLPVIYRTRPWPQLTSETPCCSHTNSSPLCPQESQIWLCLG